MCLCVVVVVEVGAISLLPPFTFLLPLRNCATWWWLVYHPCVTGLGESGGTRRARGKVKKIVEGNLIEEKKSPLFFPYFSL